MLHIMKSYLYSLNVLRYKESDEYKKVYKKRIRLYVFIKRSLEKLFSHAALVTGNVIGICMIL